MSAIRNYRRSLSERRASLSEMYQQDAKRLSESSTGAGQTSSKMDGRRDYSSDEDDDASECVQVKDAKPKDRQRRLSLDFLFFRNKNKNEPKKKTRSQSTSVGPSNEQGYSKYPSPQGV